jgi:phosphoglucosamine mutase
MQKQARNKLQLFGTDGIRGTANRELTPELAMRIGCAAVRVLAGGKARPFLLVGRDTRISGTMLESALVAGICSCGGRAELLGVIPTPAVAYLTKSVNADAGVVISASHNPAGDNGIKFFHFNGLKLPDELEFRIEVLMDGDLDVDRPSGEEVGQVCNSQDAEKDYLEHLMSVAKPDLSEKRVVVDCANGAVYRLGPMMLERLGAEVIALNVNPDGVNINRDCGSTHPEALGRAVVEEKAHLGLAFDGDADRVLAVDEKGQLVDGDFIMAICALQLKGKGELNKNALVTTVMSNLGFHRAMRREGIEVHQAVVGDRFVLEKMMDNGLNFGGEQSGHIIFLDHATTGDGLVTTMKLLEALVDSGETLSSLAGVMSKVPQLLISVKVRSKEGLDDSQRISEARRRWEEKLKDTGRILVRPSGTEPVVRVMVEDVDSSRAEEAARDLASVIEGEIG